MIIKGDDSSNAVCANPNAERGAAMSGNTRAFSHYRVYRTDCYNDDPVVTGIVQEFQFGMNWSEYSRFVGDIFGAPLALEALVAFFLESTFIGLWIFGWDRLSRGVHNLCMYLTALGSTVSAIFILAANCFMQNPVGVTYANGRAELTDFGALFTSVDRKSVV